MRAEFRRKLQRATEEALRLHGIVTSDATSRAHELSFVLDRDLTRKLLTFRERDALVVCRLQMHPEEDGPLLGWERELEPTFPTMRSVSQASSQTSAVREKTNWIYWRWSGSLKAQVPVRTPPQEGAYLDLVIPEVVTFVLRYLPEHVPDVS